MLSQIIFHDAPYFLHARKSCMQRVNHGVVDIGGAKIKRWPGWFDLGGQDQDALVISVTFKGISTESCKVEGRKG